MRYLVITAFALFLALKVVEVAFERINGIIDEYEQKLERNLEEL